MPTILRVGKWRFHFYPTKALNRLTSTSIPATANASFGYNQFAWRVRCASLAAIYAQSSAK